MTDTVLTYRATPPYTTGEYLPRVVIDAAGGRYVFPFRAFVDCTASMQTAHGMEYLLHVTRTNDAR